MPIETRPTVSPHAEKALPEKNAFSIFFWGEKKDHNVEFLFWET